MLHFRGKKIGISNLNKYKQKSNGKKCRILTYPTARAILNKSPCSVELCLRKETCDRAAAARQGGKRMKTGLRKKAILGMLLSVLVLAGCKDQKAQEFPDTPTPEYDAQNQYIFMNPQGFYEAEGFFCGTNFGDDLLRYYDKGSGISGVLCPDPACTHDTDSCGPMRRMEALLFLFTMESCTGLVSSWKATRPFCTAAICPGPTGRRCCSWTGRR